MDRSRWIGIAALVAAVSCGPTSEEEPIRAELPESESTAEARVAPVQTATDAGWEVDFSSYGPVPLGIAFMEANQAAGGVLESPGSMEGCETVHVSEGRERVGLMVVDGRITRVDVYNPEITTAQGARIGDSEEQIRALYPESLEVRPHKYTDGSYLIVTPPGADRFRLVFETARGTVQTFRAGVLPEVEWVEGCA